MSYLKKRHKHIKVVQNFYIDIFYFYCRYNLRKFAELPHNLIGSSQIEDLCREVLFNYRWLHAKISAGPITFVLEDFVTAIEHFEQRQKQELKSK